MRKLNIFINITTMPPTLCLMRHEERDLRDPTFFSPLTLHGAARASHEVLNTIDTTVNEVTQGSGRVKWIYVSPFLRCVQTAAPFARREGLALRRDFALYERVHAPESPDVRCFDSSDFRHDLPDDHELRALFDATYKSSVPIECAGAWNEDVDAIRTRATAFMTHLWALHCVDDDASGTGTGDDIVLVITHLSVVNAMRGAPDDAPLDMGGMHVMTSEEWMNR